MKAVLRLECIGDDARQYLRLGRMMANEACSGAGDAMVGDMPARWWVAKIAGRDQKYRYRREFLRGFKDYDRANSCGSRGVEMVYTLDQGCVYEVQSPQTWARNDRYFCRVDDGGEIQRITREEVDAWLDTQRAPSV